MGSEMCIRDSSSIGRRMAIVLDGVIQTAPQINGQISDSGQITVLTPLMKLETQRLYFEAVAYRST